MKVGGVFGRLTYVGEEPRKDGRPMGLFKCSCGALVVRNVENVAYGSTSSCGCLKREMTIRRNHKHGRTKTREYKIWASMLQRCYNPATNSFKYYGARGVNVCDSWHVSFESFFEDMGEAPAGTSLERLDITVDYCKENCVWADDMVQANNKSNNIVIEFQGKSQTLKQWAIDVAIDYHALYYRWQNGWSVEKILTTPSAKTTRKTA